MEKTDPRGQSTRLGLPYTDVSHGCVHVAGLTTGWSNRTGRVPIEPKYSPIRKRPIFRALKHSKAYLNTCGGT
ncbi:Patched domain-containing protein [Gossypium arboreum]|uniref:Patched domain-containing protein n=1 Tax=Gossypium arboreum TaxID=29729 RepID=A0A0B0NXY0_GOSAR|nr:Patched domain-containing protein [Gossypium arboreum]